MLLPEYRDYFEKLFFHSRLFIENNCRLTGSIERILNKEADPHFLNDYRYYAFAKSTKTLSSVIQLLDMGNYEDALTLSRTILECYLSQRYFDENFDLKTIMDMVVIPTGIFQGILAHFDGVVTKIDTGEELPYNLRSPSSLSVGKDKPYFYNLYYFLCENAHCNISQIGFFLDEEGRFTLDGNHSGEIPHLFSLFIFSKIFENVVLLESSEFKDPGEEKACCDLLTDLTAFLYEKLYMLSHCPLEKSPYLNKTLQKTAKDMLLSLKEQLGRVDKAFVSVLARQNVETPLEAKLKPALLNYEKPSFFFENLREKKKLSPRYNELEKLIGLPQDPRYHPEGDVWNHTMEVLDRAALYRDKVSNPYGFMLLALTHDLGKISTTEVTPEGRIHSYDHENKLFLARKLLERITNKERVRQYVLSMIPFHMKPRIYSTDRSGISSTDKFFRAVPYPEDIIYFTKADKCLSQEEEAFLWDRYSHAMNETGSK